VKHFCSNVVKTERRGTREAAKFFVSDACFPYRIASM
jgi:hypothetical protein